MILKLLNPLRTIHPPVHYMAALDPSMLEQNISVYLLAAVGPHLLQNKPPIFSCILDAESTFYMDCFISRICMLSL